MASVDVNSFFTNILFDGAIDIYINKLSRSFETLVNRISKDEFPNLLNLATKGSFFRCNNMS